MSEIKLLLPSTLGLGRLFVNGLVRSHPGNPFADHGRNTISLIHRKLNGGPLDLNTRIAGAEGLNLRENLLPQTIPIFTGVLFIRTVNFQPDFTLG